jgi:hypothetical protein
MSVTILIDVSVPVVTERDLPRRMQSRLERLEDYARALPPIKPRPGVLI